MIMGVDPGSSETAYVILDENLKKKSVIY